jgi:hypothetical protein
VAAATNLKHLQILKPSADSRKFTSLLEHRRHDANDAHTPCRKKLTISAMPTLGIPFTGKKCPERVCWMCGWLREMAFGHLPPMRRHQKFRIGVKLFLLRLP